VINKTSITSVKGVTLMPEKVSPLFPDAWLIGRILNKQAVNPSRAVRILFGNSPLRQAPA
jgi:hypothetical protein